MPLLCGALVALALGACASVPEASRESDAQAKEFGTHPGAATIYVFRNDRKGDDPTMEDTALYVDNRLIGGTLPGTFFRVDVRPGQHLLHGFGYDQGSLKVNARSGETHFVSLNVMNGTSHYKLVEPESGKRELARCCTLMENWAPGQRPLLR